MHTKTFDTVFENRYICQKEIKQGAFGIVYQGFDLIDKKIVAIKLEKDKKSHTTSSLTNEARILSKINGVKGVPALFWSGKHPSNEERALIMTFLGKDLQFQLLKLKYFSEKTVLMCAVQLLKILQSVHNRGIVHRDIKPDNILTCYEEEGIVKPSAFLKEKELNQLYLCDFGISKAYREGNKHIEYKINKPFIGTIRFASEAAHKGNEVSRKDDLESLGYVLVYLLKGKLPWQNIDKSLGNIRKDRVGESKTLDKILEYFKELPEEYLLFFKYTKNLTFKENPNYEYLIGLFQDLAKKKGINLEDGIWDWKNKYKGSNFTNFGPISDVKKHNENSLLKQNKKIEEKKMDSKIGDFKKKNNSPPPLLIIKKKKTLSESDESSSHLLRNLINMEEMSPPPKINIKKNNDIFSDNEGKKKKKLTPPPIFNKVHLGHEHDESNDKEVYFNSKSFISSNNETHEDSVLIKNKDFTTLKMNFYDLEENGKNFFINDRN